MPVASNSTCSILHRCCLTSLLSFAPSSLQPSTLQEQSVVLPALVIYEYESLLLTAANNTIQWQYVAMVKQEYPNVLYTIKALICSYCLLHLLILTEKSKIANSKRVTDILRDRSVRRVTGTPVAGEREIYIFIYAIFTDCCISKVKTLFFYIYNIYSMYYIKLQSTWFSPM